MTDCKIRTASSIDGLIAPVSSVSLLGMCKNAGKTTTLNRLIGGIRRAGKTLAVTSIGRDGESTDVVTGTEKPGIFVYAGTVFATGTDLLRLCDVTKEILDVTPFRTPMGDVVVARALSDGFVQLAGPSLTTQVAAVAETFRSFGAEKILIDGALERKSLGTGKVCEAAVLCTGASYNRNQDVVVRDTAFICTLLGLPATDKKVTPADTRISIDAADGTLRVSEAARPGTDITVNAKYLPVAADGALYVPKIKTSPEDIWSRRVKQDLSARFEDLPADVSQSGFPAIYVQGGLTDAMIRPLLTSGADLRGKTLLFKDGSRVLISFDTYDKLCMKGLSFAVLDPIRLLAVTVNPFSAYGFHFDKDTFLARMREAVSMPVYDVMSDCA
ncbi:MAG: hypothetical protein IJQ21_13605 [Lachnospiraceae bacterium]|nr:hypothetical protein [Lachnospiraceae bacterium]